MGRDENIRTEWQTFAALAIESGTRRSRARSTLERRHCTLQRRVIDPSDSLKRHHQSVSVSLPGPTLKGWKACRTEEGKGRVCRSGRLHDLMRGEVWKHDERACPPCDVWSSGRGGSLSTHTQRNPPPLLYGWEPAREHLVLRCGLVA